MSKRFSQLHHLTMLLTINVRAKPYLIQRFNSYGIFSFSSEAAYLLTRYSMCLGAKSTPPVLYNTCMPGSLSISRHLKEIYPKALLCELHVE